jgi:hypothetical protein
MTTFQFDKCFNDKKVIKACNEEGLVVARKLDREMNDAKDPEILDYYIRRGNPLITIDRALPEEHAQCIPDVNPGLVVVAYSKYIDRNREQLKTMTTRAVARILHHFKQEFPEWDRMMIANRIFEITDKYISISRVASGKLILNLHLEFATDPEWTSRLRDFLGLPALTEPKEPDQLT